MTPDRQTQRGDGPQIEAGSAVPPVVSVGLDMEVVIQVFELKAELLRNEMTQIAESRVSEALGKLQDQIGRRFDRPELIAAFAEPDFQANIYEAQVSAVRSGKQEDIDLLVDLLVNRASSGDSVRMRMATRKALETVGQLTDGAIAALTVLFFMTMLSPEAAELEPSLRTIQDNLGTIAPDLPLDRSWLADLDLLDCIQASLAGFGNSKSFVQLIGQNNCPAFTCAGLPARMRDAILQKLVLGDPRLAQLVIGHPLEDDRIALLGRNMESTRRCAQSLCGGTLTKGADLAVEEVIGMISLQEKIPKWEDKLRARLADFPALVHIDAWWSELPALQVTAVGAAIGYANLTKHVPTMQLPSLPQLLST